MRFNKTLLTGLIVLLSLVAIAVAYFVVLEIVALVTGFFTVIAGGIAGTA